MHCLCLGMAAARGASAPKYSFVVFGDNQFATNSPTSGVPERMAIPKVIMELHPDFILHTGDLMDHGRDAIAYERFVAYYRDMLATLPFFPTMGNHDAGYVGIRNYKAYLREQLFKRNPAVYGPGYSKEVTLWFEDDPVDYPTRFDSPRVSEFKARVPSGVCFKTCYAFRFRNAYFISLEQGTRWWTNTPLPWLEKHLKQAAEDPGVEYTFVYMHHPMYSSVMAENPPDPKRPGVGECIAPVRASYEDLFRRYDVTMVFSGHTHLYDRFYVPDDGHATHTDPPASSFPNDEKGIHYLVTGGGGGALDRGHWRHGPSEAYQQNRLCAHHVTEVQVRDGGLTVRIHRVKGSAEKYQHTVFDTFSIGR